MDSFKPIFPYTYNPTFMILDNFSSIWKGAQDYLIFVGKSLFLYAKNSPLL